jgi:phosphoglycerate kinase
MAFTFLKSLGFTTGRSPVEDDQLEYAKSCLAKANGRIVLPVDTVVSDAFDPAARTVVQVLDDTNVPSDLEGLDVGPKTRELFANEISKAKMVFWNGPMGVFEQEDFQKGTVAVCEAIAKLDGQAFTVCGGGDSAAAIKQFGYASKFSHVSTGGGASLEMIENDGHLPGIDVIIG